MSEVKWNDADGVRRVALDGEMTIYHATALKDQLLAAVADGAAIELDLAGVSEIDSAGAQLVLLARREAAAHGGSASIGACSDAARELLELYRIGAQNSAGQSEANA